MLNKFTKIKRTLLFSILLLIAGGLRAENVYLLTAQTINGTAGSYSDTISAHKFTLSSGTVYTYTITSLGTNSDLSAGGTFSFRIKVDGWSYEMQPYIDGDVLTINGDSYTITTDCYGSDKAWKVTVPASTYDSLTITVDISESSRYVKVTGTVSSSSTGYYLYCDWNEWGENMLANTFQLEPTGNDHEYRIYLSADYYHGRGFQDYFTSSTSSYNFDGTLDFKIWDAANGAWIGNSESSSISFANDSGSAVSGSSGYNWSLVTRTWSEQTDATTETGDMYEFIYNDSTGAWTINYLNDQNVDYFIYTTDSSEYKMCYLFEERGKNDNGNFFGKIYLAEGTKFVIFNGYYFVGDRTASDLWYELTANDDSDRENMLDPSAITWATVGDTDGQGNTISGGYYFMEYNALSLASLNTAKSSFTITYKGGDVTEWTEMTYDTNNDLWYGETDMNFTESTTSALGRIGYAKEYATYNDSIYYYGSTAIYPDDYLSTSDSTSSTTSEAIASSTETNYGGTYRLVYKQSTETATGEAEMYLKSNLYTVASTTIRTFSDYVPHIIPDGVTAYYASAYDSTNHVVTLTDISEETDGVIPANTGVVLVYYTDNATSTSLEHADLDGGITSYLPPSSSTTTLTSTNYLVPTILNTDLAPVTDGDSDGAISSSSDTRNYYLSYYYDTDGTTQVLSFNRCKKETFSTINVIRKAYLALPATVQTDSSLDEVTSSTSSTSAAAKVFLYFSDRDISTGISNINVTDNVSEQKADNKYYNLMGIEVNNPQHGIFIHNGKKIVFR
jgi:hypothetical protein